MLPLLGPVDPVGCVDGGGVGGATYGLIVTFVEGRAIDVLSTLVPDGLSMFDPDTMAIGDETAELTDFAVNVILINGWLPLTELDEKQATISTLLLPLVLEVSGTQFVKGPVLKMSVSFKLK